MNVLVMLRDEQKHYLTTDTTLFFKQQHPYIYVQRETIQLLTSVSMLNHSHLICNWLISK